MMGSVSGFQGSGQIVTLFHLTQEHPDHEETISSFIGIVGHPRHPPPDHI